MSRTDSSRPTTTRDTPRCRSGIEGREGSVPMVRCCVGERCTRAPLRRNPTLWCTEMPRLPTCCWAPPLSAAHLASELGPLWGHDGHLCAAVDGQVWGHAADQLHHAQVLPGRAANSTRGERPGQGGLKKQRPNRGPSPPPPHPYITATHPGSLSTTIPTIRRRTCTITASTPDRATCRTRSCTCASSSSNTAGGGRGGWKGMGGVVAGAGRQEWRDGSICFARRACLRVLPASTACTPGPPILCCSGTAAAAPSSP